MASKLPVDRTCQSTQIYLFNVLQIDRALRLDVPHFEAGLQGVFIEDLLLVAAGDQKLLILDSRGQLQIELVEQLDCQLV